MRKVTLAATQMACSDDRNDNMSRAEALVRKAAAAGANVVLLQELFENRYFCQDESPSYYSLAKPAENHPAVIHFQGVAKELGVVLPISFFELAGNARFNTVSIIDADGSVLGLYRKSHIPHGSGYQEKFYFTPGDTGFRVWDTAFGKLGCGICWDQWFPESARSMALLGAEFLMYPTAIGSELLDPKWDSAPHWQRVQQGHAGANLLPYVASNRVGTEPGLSGTELKFYGSSFIAGPTGEMLAEADRDSETAITATIDLDEVAEMRAFWGIYRDRRPELYGRVGSHDGGLGL